MDTRHEETNHIISDRKRTPKLRSIRRNLLRLGEHHEETIVELELV